MVRGTKKLWLVLVGVVTPNFAYASPTSAPASNPTAAAESHEREGGTCREQACFRALTSIDSAVDDEVEGPEWSPLAFCKQVHEKETANMTLIPEHGRDRVTQDCHGIDDFREACTCALGPPRKPQHAVWPAELCPDGVRIDEETVGKDYIGLDDACAVPVGYDFGVPECKDNQCYVAMDLFIGRNKIKDFCQDILNRQAFINEEREQPLCPFAKQVTACRCVASSGKVKPQAWQFPQCDSDRCSAALEMVQGNSTRSTCQHILAFGQSVPELGLGCNFAGQFKACRCIAPTLADESFQRNWKCASSAMRHVEDIFGSYTEAYCQLVNSHRFMPLIPIVQDVLDKEGSKEKIAWSELKKACECSVREQRLQAEAARQAARHAPCEALQCYPDLNQAMDGDLTYLDESCGQYLRARFNEGEDDISEFLSEDVSCSPEDISSSCNCVLPDDSEWSHPECKELKCYRGLEDNFNGNGTASQKFCKDVFTLIEAKDGWREQLEKARDSGDEDLLEVIQEEIDADPIPYDVKITSPLLKNCFAELDNLVSACSCMLPASETAPAEATGDINAPEETAEAGGR